MEVELHGGHDLATALPPPPAPRERRRGLDRTWQAEQELDFSFRASEAPSPQANELHDATFGDLPAVLAPSSPSTNQPVHVSESATLRRVKHLESEVACSIENECGIDVTRGLEVFRLVLLNTESRVLRRATRVLLLAQEAFLCEDPRAAAESEVFREAPSTTEAKMRSQSWINLDLRFFRATPKGDKGRRLGTSLPVLHLTLSTEDGNVQAMEFIGKHQRQYYAETGECACDAIAQNLTESLLRVALEFVFHPSRNKFTRELVIVRECSVEPEALQRREELLPRMLQKLRGSNEKVKEIILEFGGQLYVAAQQKEKSFVVLDEDVLKVVPAKEQMKAEKRGETTTAFKRFNKGFLNNKAVSKGCPTDSEKMAQTSMVSAATSTPSPPAPAVATTREEKHQLLMAAASPAPGAAQHRALVSNLTAEPPAEPEEEPEELGEALHISQLASQLFGDASDEEPQEPQELPQEPPPPPPPPADDVDDLVALWMKQRW